MQEQGESQNLSKTSAIARLPHSFCGRKEGRERKRNLSKAMSALFQIFFLAFTIKPGIISCSGILNVHFCSLYLTSYVALLMSIVTHRTEGNTLIFFAKLCEKYSSDKWNWRIGVQSVFSTYLDIYSAETWYNKKESIHSSHCLSQADLQAGNKRSSVIFWFSSEQI